jgi:hypothetical protein
MSTIERKQIELNEDEIRRREETLARLILIAAQKRWRRERASFPSKVPSRTEGIIEN